MRVLQQGWLISEIVSSGEVSKHQLDVLKTSSKELDRANRAFLAATRVLLQMKAEPLKIQMKAKNAFIANNQQFNSTDL
jgi:hypothetical protein